MALTAPRPFHLPYGPVGIPNLVAKVRDRRRRLRRPVAHSESFSGSVQNDRLSRRSSRLNHRNITYSYDRNVSSCARMTMEKPNDKKLIA